MISSTTVLQTFATFPKPLFASVYSIDRSYVAWLMTSRNASGTRPAWRRTWRALMRLSDNSAASRRAINDAAIPAVNAAGFIIKALKNKAVRRQRQQKEI